VKNYHFNNALMITKLNLNNRCYWTQKLKNVAVLIKVKNSSGIGFLARSD